MLSGVNVYAAHFGLSTGPFGLTPDPAFLYLSPGHREALAAVECGLLERRGFITLVGEVGTGKTTLLYSLLARLDAQLDVAFVGYTAQTFDDLLAAALKDLGVTPPNGSRYELVCALNEHLMRRAAEGRTVALVIDEAQNLSDETLEALRLLSNFETYSEKLLQIVLIGQTELEERLRRPQLRQLRERVSVHATIEPLSAADTDRYIAHRLALAGGPRTLFTRAARRLIARRARGIPRRVNILCHNALLFAYSCGRTYVSAAVARQAIDAIDARTRRPVGTFRVAGGAVAAAVAVVTVAGGATRFVSRQDGSVPEASARVAIPSVPPATLPVVAAAAAPPPPDAPPARREPPPVPAKRPVRRVQTARHHAQPGDPFFVRVPRQLLAFVLGRDGDR
jgi:general secretion pathway protein A